eukprot:TRINITY_DN539_c0_g1_i3.p1 TRINITY_DN539_c0_g1~~TRINITY_DN539_c0_g1_i3.p1  ORF type:complete len:185 (+),score=17.99 TRINITY_DN539_c0_g1_i3:31-585(+)
METNASSSSLLFFDICTDFIYVGTRSGYKIFKTDPFTLEHADDTIGCRLLSSVPHTYFLAAVGEGRHPTESQRVVHIINVSKKKEIVSLPFMIPVLRLLTNKSRIAVVLESEIHIYDIHYVNFLKKIEFTAKNPKGIAAINSSGKNLLAYPGSADKGDIVLYDCSALQVINTNFFILQLNTFHS